MKSISLPLTYLAILGFTFLSIDVRAQSPDWIWGQNIGPGTTITVTSCATDSSGHVYVAGYSSSSIPVVFGTDTIPGATTTIFFLAKCDAIGNVLWARSAIAIGGNMAGAINSISTDGAGNAFVTGYFDANYVIFGTDTLRTTGMFVAKYAASGTVLWAKCATGATAGSVGKSIASDASGNVFVAGYSQSRIMIFGTDTLKYPYSTNGDGLFIAKYDYAGNFQWAKNPEYRTQANSTANAVAADASGNVYVVGTMDGSLIFGSDTLTANIENALIIKYDGSGNALWAKTPSYIDIYVNNDVIATCVSIDATGNVYVGGTFATTAIVFGGDTLTNPSQASANGNANMFLTKYNAAGSVLWAKALSEYNSVTLTSMSSDELGDVFVAGWFWNDSIVFGMDTLIINPVDYRNYMFISKYDKITGNVIWAKTNNKIQGSHGNGVQSISTNRSGDIYAAGFFTYPAIVFGPDTLASIYGGTFLAKISSGRSCIPPTVSATPANISCHGNADGAVNLAVSGGVTPYHYLWSNSDTTQNIANLNGGNYTVTVTGANSCSASASASVFEPAPISFTASVNGISCFNANDGSINVNVSGGTPGYQFAWFPVPDTSGSLSNLSGGTYSLSVTDAHGCVITDSFNIINPVPLYTQGVIVNPSCSGSTGSIYTHGNGGAPPYSFHWSNGDSTQNITGLVGGSYYVTTTDAHYCFGVSLYVVNSPAPLVDTVVYQAIQCYGGSTALSSVITGGTPPYIYLWNTGATDSTLPTAKSGNYSLLVTDSNRCQTLTNISLTQPAAIGSVINASICTGSHYAFKGSNLTLSGTYKDTLTAGNGCDSTVTLNLSVLSTIHDTIRALICQGSSYHFNGRTLTATGTYIDTLNGSNCDSIVVLMLAVGNTLNTEINATICHGNTYLFKGTDIGFSGTYKDTVTAAGGCDSIITLHLTVSPLLQGSLSETICGGTVFNFNGLSVSQTGDYKDTIQNANGCDSVITLHLTVSPAHYDTINAVGCGIYIYNGLAFFQSGTYHVTLGCDTQVTVNFTLVDTLYSSISGNICAGGSYNFNGTHLTHTGIYYDTLLSFGGCDSIVTLTLGSSTVVVNAAMSICTGSSYPFGISNLTTSGVYRDTLIASGGCDSIVILTLTVNPLPVATITSNGGVLSTGTFSSYQWLNAGTVISGETSQSYTPANDGDYAVIVTDSTHCSDTSAVYHFIGLGIGQGAGESGVSIFPNPTSSSFTVTIPSTTKQIQITNSIGQVLQTKITTGQTSEVFELAADGIYFVQILTGTKAITKKLTVCR